MNTILTDPSEILGEIYLITNTVTHKCYVGQTLTHRKNHGKYRPFGHEGRFRDHISEAVCNTKKKQCSYLNNAIRQYGAAVFNVVLLEQCDREHLDAREQHYISIHGTLYPNGYNLTIGGKGQRYITPSDITPSELNVPRQRGGCTERSEATRKKMSAQLKIAFADADVRLNLMKRTQCQHLSAKLAQFSGVHIDSDNLEQYIRIRNNKNNGTFIKIIVDDKSTSFVGKHEALDDLKKRAIEFLQNVHRATLSNCSGKP